MGRRWLRVLGELLRQGISPEKIALTVALGAVIGVIPVLGATTLLCAGLAFVLRLNPAAIQVVNGVVYPLQLIFLIPFYRLGAWVFGADASEITLGGVKALIGAGALAAIRALWVVTMHALVVWAGVGAAVGAVIYALVLPLARRVGARASARAEEVTVRGSGE
jgi:uncharacterized protein (DUF2062 family)